MIRRIEALNYRCLRYLMQPLQSFHVLVGPNAAGKSAFLDVLGLIRDFLQVGLGEAILTPGDLSEPQGRARRVDELIFNQVAERFELAVEVDIPPPLREVTNGKDPFVRYEISLGKDSVHGGLTILGETLWLCSARRRDPVQAGPPTLFPEEPVPPETIFAAPGRKRSPSGWRKIVNKSGTGNDYFQSETSGWNNVFRVGPRKAALANLPEDEERFPVALWVRNLLREKIHTLALNSAAMRRPSSPSAQLTFQVDGSNLPLVLRELRENHRETFADWLEHIRTVLPEIRDIRVIERPEDRHLYLAVHYGSGGEPVPSWLLSDGTLRLLALTLLAYLPEQEGVYLIEEPENGIHPRAIEAVFQSLSSVYDGQVLLATHSPLILRLARLEQILCFARNPSGATGVITGRDHPRLRDWRGQTDLATSFCGVVCSVGSQSQFKALSGCSFHSLAMKD